MKPLLPLLLLGAVLGGCDLVGDDYDDLAPGTFRFRADGKTYTGTACFYPRSESSYKEPFVFLLSTDSIPLYMESRDLLAASKGRRIEGSVSFRPGVAIFVNWSGATTITGTPDDGLSGTFRYGMKDISMATSGTESITVEGGFNAVRVPD